MSGIAAIFNRDGRPAEESLLRRMTGAIAHRGPDGSGHWLQGAVGLGHCMLRTTPESLRERQPLQDETGQLCMTLDGRVDNRSELQQALEAKGARLRSDTDAELVLKAYEIWGEECPGKILGDFAFAIWDGRKRQLFCARDIMGINPLYYWSGDHTVLIASELRQILADPCVPREPNEAVVAEYLASSISLEETLYRGVLRLPRAHCLLITADRIQKRCYWTMDWNRKVSCGSDSEYAARFLEIFGEAVRCRLRSVTPVGAELSGGLDSSSVVAAACKVLTDDSNGPSKLQALSLVFPGLECDESFYIDRVAERWNLSSARATDSVPEASVYADEIRGHGDFPDGPTVRMHNPLMQFAQEQNIRVVLGGDGGDEWLLGSPYHGADLLRSFRLGAAYRQSGQDARWFRDLGVPRSAASVFFRYAVWPQLPAGVRGIVRRSVHREASVAPRWVGSDLARRVGLSQRLREQQEDAKGCKTIAQRETVGAKFHFPWYCTHSRYTSGYGLEYRSPFLDRRVIEFCTAVPEDQRRRDGQNKFVLRQAMRGLLPEEVRARRTKVRFECRFPGALDALGGRRFFQSLQIESLGWIDGHSARDMYQQMSGCYARSDAGYRRYVWPLWMIAGTELWYRTLFGRGAAFTGTTELMSRNHERQGEKKWTNRTVSMSH